MWRIFVKQGCLVLYEINLLAIFQMFSWCQSISSLGLQTLEVTPSSNFYEMTEQLRFSRTCPGILFYLLLTQWLQTRYFSCFTPDKYLPCFHSCPSDVNILKESAEEQIYMHVFSSTQSVWIWSGQQDTGRVALASRLNRHCIQDVQGGIVSPKWVRLAENLVVLSNGLSHLTTGKKLPEPTLTLMPKGSNRQTDLARVNLY